VKEILFKTLVGTTAFFLFIFLSYIAIQCFLFLDDSLGYGAGALFITSPLWVPVAYLGGDLILKNKESIVNFLKRAIK
jgi:hypothetical protein